MGMKEATEQDLAAAEAKVATLTARLDALTGRSQSMTPNDPGWLTRSESDRGRARRFNAYRRESEAWHALEAAQEDARIIAHRLATQKRNVPVPFTEEQYKAAKAVRTKNGWRLVAKVNAKSVSVETGYSWTDRIPREQIIEVR